MWAFMCVDSSRKGTFTRQFYNAKSQCVLRTLFGLEFCTNLRFKKAFKAHKL